MLTLIQLVLSNLLFFGLHFDGKNNFPKQLSSSEEAECIKLASTGDKQAMDKLIVHNLRLVAYIVKKNYPDAKDQDDLVSIGTIGLIRAAETFDYSKGHQFSTYASKCIDKAITQLKINSFLHYKAICNMQETSQKLRLRGFCLYYEQFSCRLLS